MGGPGSPDVQRLGTFLLCAGSTPAPTVIYITVTRGDRRCGGLSCRRSRDREARIVGGSRSADRSSRLGVGSLVLAVDVLEIEIVHTSLCGGWEGVVLLQLVLAGQKTLESGHGYGGRGDGVLLLGDRWRG